jgi:hypothetical protein
MCVRAEYKHSVRCNGETHARCRCTRQALLVRFLLTARCFERIIPTILVSMWACTRPSASLHRLPHDSLGGRAPSVRFPRVVVILTEYLFAWLGVVSSHSRGTLLTHASTRLQDEWDEAVLVGVLAALTPAKISTASPGWCRCPGRRSAGSRRTQRRRREPIPRVHGTYHRTMVLYLCVTLT